jgi:hypothetical protein
MTRQLTASVWRWSGRCAPPTSADFKEHRRDVQQHRLSLRHVLARDAGDGGTSLAWSRTADAGATAGSRPASAPARRD